MFIKKTDATMSLRLLTVCLLPAICGCGQQSGNNLPPKQAQAVEALEALGAIVSTRNGEVTLIDFFSTRDIAAAVAHLEPFVDLKKINFGGTDITDDELASLAQLVNLEELALKGTKVTADGLKHLVGLNKLVVLNLDDCQQLSDEGLVYLKDLTNLKRLHLNKTNISDAGLVHLIGLVNLESLLAYDTQVTPAGADQLRQSLPEVNVVAPEITKEEPAASAEAAE